MVIEGAAPMFEVRNLSAAYGQSQVLHGIDLSVGRGEIVVLVGRNGMGKSTLMKSLIGLMPSRSGQIFVDGAEVTKLPRPPARRPCATCEQACRESRKETDRSGHGRGTQARDPGQTG